MLNECESEQTSEEEANEYMAMEVFGFGEGIWAFSKLRKEKGNAGSRTSMGGWMETQQKKKKKGSREQPQMSHLWGHLTDVSLPPVGEVKSLHCNVNK